VDFQRCCIKRGGAGLSMREVWHKRFADMSLSDWPPSAQ